MAIDIQRLKRDLMDYYGTAMHNGFPMAVMDVIDIENASLRKLEELANRAGFNMAEYEEDEMER